MLDDVQDEVNINTASSEFVISDLTVQMFDYYISHISVYCNLAVAKVQALCPSAVCGVVYSCIQEAICTPLLSQ